MIYKYIVETSLPSILYNTYTHIHISICVIRTSIDNTLVVFNIICVLHVTLLNVNTHIFSKVSQAQ